MLFSFMALKKPSIIMIKGLDRLQNAGAPYPLGSLKCMDLKAVRMLFSNKRVDGPRATRIADTIGLRGDHTSLYSNVKKIP